MSTSETLVNQLLENDVTSQNYSELRDAMRLLEIYETSLREKRQIMSIKLRKYYMNQYMELRKKKPFTSIIISE
jgi:hypothetical protein